MLQNRMSIYFNHPSQGILTNYYLILGPRDKAAHPTSQQIKTFPPKRVNNLATASSIFICISSSSTGELCSQPIRGNVRRIGHVSRTCWAKLLDSEYSFVAVRRILRTIFAKQTFAQWRTNYIRRILPTSMFAQLRTGFTVSVDVKLHWTMLRHWSQFVPNISTDIRGSSASPSPSFYTQLFRGQELCESRGGRVGLSVLTSLIVSVDVKQYWTMLTHWSQLVPNMSTDIQGH